MKLKRKSQSAEMSKAMKISVWLILCVCWLAGMYQISFGQKPELVVQTGHSNKISALEFSPKGDLLAALSASGEDGLWTSTIKIWDVKTGISLRTFQGGRRIHFSPDRNYLATSDFAVVRIYDVKSGELFREDIVCSLVSNILFSPNSKRLAVNTDSGLKLIDLTYSEKTGCLQGKQYPTFMNVESMAFKADGKSLIIISSEGEVFDWDGGEIRRSMYKLQGLKFGPINIKEWDVLRHTITFHPTEEIFLFSKENRASQTYLKTYFFDARTREIIPMDTICDVKGLKFSSNGATFAVFNKEVIQIFDTKTRKEIKKIGFSASSMPFALSPEGKVIATGINCYDEDNDVPSLEKCPTETSGNLFCLGDNDSIAVWDLQTVTPMKILRSNVAETTSLAFNEKGDVLVVGNKDGTVDLWDFKNNTATKTLIEHNGAIDSLAVNTEAKLIATSSIAEGEFVTVWNLNTGESLKMERKDNYYDYEVCSLAFVDNDQLAGLCPQNELRIWNIKDGKAKTYSLNTAEGKDRATKISNKFALQDLFKEQIEPLVSWEDWLRKNLKSVKCIAPLSKRLEQMIFMGGVGGGPQLPIFENWNDIYIAKGKIGAVVLGNDGVKLWNEETCEEIANLVFLNESDWLVTTPDGFFDGTPNAQKQILWRLNNNTFDVVPVEAFYYEYFYPGLLKKILAGEKPELPKNANPKSFAQKDIRQAEVKICQKCPCPENEDFSQTNLEAKSANSEICVDILASANFTTNDFVDFKALANKLVNLPKPIYQKVFATFTPDSQTKLRNYLKNPKEELKTELLQMMRRELGALLRQDDFFKNYQVFASSTTLKLARSNPQGNETAWLNRRLLEDIFPEIRKGKISNLNDKEECPEGELCLQDMRLFWNNRLIQRWRDDMLSRENDCKYISNFRINCQTTVPIVAGTENKFSAYLFNQDRVKSLDGEIVFK